MLIEFAYCKAEPLREPFHLPRRNMSCIILLEAAQPFVPLFSSAAINIILHSLINANPLGPPDTKDKRQRTSAKRRCNKEPSTEVKTPQQSEMAVARIARAGRVAIGAS